MKSGKPLVLVVNHHGTVQRGPTSAARGRSQLRLVAKNGVIVPGETVARVTVVRVTVVRVTKASPPASLSSAALAQRPPRSLSRPFGRRVVQVANDVAVLALALLAGLRPLA